MGNTGKRWEAETSFSGCGRRVWHLVSLDLSTRLHRLTASNLRLRHRCIHQPAVEENIVKVEIKASLDKPKLQTSKVASDNIQSVL